MKYLLDKVIIKQCVSLMCDYMTMQVSVDEKASNSKRAFCVGVHRTQLEGKILVSLVKGVKHLMKM